MRTDHMTRWLINARLGVGYKEVKQMNNQRGKKESETNKGEKHSAFKIKCKLTGNDPQSGKV